MHRLRAAGAIVIGKTVTSQYALFVPGPTQESPRRHAYAGWIVERIGGSGRGEACARRARHTDERLDHPASLLLRNRRFQAEPRRPAAHRSVAACDAHRPSGRNGAERRRRGAHRRRDCRRGSARSPVAQSDGFDAGRRASATARSPRLAYALGPFEARAEPATREAFAAFIANLPVRVDAIELGPEFAAAEATLRDLMCAGVAESLGPDIDSATRQSP